jgi:CoA:oxalate CoA-transferase
MTAAERTGPLSGITVIDLTRVLAGPYCTKLLYDLGARVIKVEAPGTGDNGRAVGPFVDNMSAYFLSLNYGKESVVLDLKAQADRAIFETMIGRADVLVENFRAGIMEKLGLGWRHLNKLNDQLIYAAISGFGASGPYANKPAYDMVVQGMGGIMSITGEEGGGPVRVGVSIGDITAGLYAAQAVNAALFDRTRTARGAKLDLSMLDCQVAITENAQARYHATGQVPGALGSRHPVTAPFDRFETADAIIIIAVGSDVTFRRLCEALGVPELADDPAFEKHAVRAENHEPLNAAIAPLLRAKTSAYWLDCLDKAGVPAGPVNSIEQVAADPQVKARNMLVGFDRKAAPDMRIAGNPVKLTGLPDPATRPWAPVLDEHGLALRREFAPSAGEDADDAP